MKIWTLKSKITGKGEELNGKLFHVKKNDHSSAIFVDLETLEEAWITSPVVDVENDGNCKILKTQSGSVYELIDVTSLIPTKLVNPAEATSVEIKDPILVVDQVFTRKPINYCDGFKKNEFTFNRDITEDEFIEWLLANSYKIHKAEGWWDEYSEITGGGNMWTHTWIDPYKD